LKSQDIPLQQSSFHILIIRSIAIVIPIPTTITIHNPIAILATKAITFIVQSHRAAAHAPLLSPDAKYFPLESNATDVTWLV
jgi:hypothetical protein